MVQKLIFLHNTIEFYTHTVHRKYLVKNKEIKLT